MTAARHDFHLDQGATFRRTFEYQNPDGTAYDLSGWTARMQVRRRHDSAAALVTATPTVDGAAGVLTVTLSSAQTAALPSGRCVYDIELVAPGGDITRLVEGSIHVRPEVTR